MPVCEDDDRCVCGHIRLEHGVDDIAFGCRVCSCKYYRDDHAKKIERWACGYCKTEYLTKEEALSCGESRSDPQFAVGDVVIDTSYRYGWFDGDAEWVADYRLRHDPNRQIPRDKSATDLKLTAAGYYQYSFYYVIVQVRKNRGSCKEGWSYDIETRAMSRHGSGHWSRLANEHLEKAETVPEKVAEEAARVKKVYEDAKTVTFT